jgi:hypothetical protein
MRCGGPACDATAWSEPEALTDDITAAKEPAAVVDGDGALRLFWRSQRRGAAYRSRTLDFNDPEMLARLGTFDDRAHYTYDTGIDNEDWYARDTVGVYLTPDVDDADKLRRRIQRMTDFIDPFRPINVRFVWLKDAAVFEEVIDAGRIVTDTFSDVIE